MTSFVNKNTNLISSFVRLRDALMLLLLPLALHAQNVKICGQVQLNKWGIRPGNYSGITHVKDNTYAICDDKDNVDGFYLQTLDIDTVTGKVRHAVLTEPEGVEERRRQGIKTFRDCEGVAYYAPANTVFVSGEEDQRIVEYAMDGTPTGRELAIPSIMARDKIVTNLGFEALTYNDKTKLFWATTESTLPADGMQADVRHPNVVNKLRFVSFGTDLKPVKSFVYAMEKPEATNKKAHSIHGVPSLCALDDGRIIVMEREGCFPKKEYGSWVKIKLFVVNPKEVIPVSLDTPMSEVTDAMLLSKHLLCEFKTRLRLGKLNLSNYEGMCLGPRLADGRQTLILIADSQNGLGNWLYHIKDHIRVIILDKL